MTLNSIFYRDPAITLEQAQIQDIKHKQGCAVCEMRDQGYEMVLCSVPGRVPGHAGYCKHWQYDEGENNGRNTEAA